MTKSQKAHFQLKEHFITQSSIEFEERKPSNEFDIEIIPKGVIKKEQSIFQLSLNIKIKEKANNVRINVFAKANFLFNSEKINKETLPNLFYINAPAILFPYIRAYISTLTNLSGYGPINLPALNLTNLKDKLSKNTTEAK